MDTEYRIVIPARLAASRLPRKPLQDIGGRPLVEHVWMRARESRAVDVLIATDSAEIEEVCRSFGAQVQMTSSDHQSGTDRIAECAEEAGWPDGAIVVNLQGDEPLMPPECLDQVAALLAENPQAEAASLYAEENDPALQAEPDVVKVVLKGDETALYFSRAAIPCGASSAGVHWKRHIGLYAYRAVGLRRFTARSPGKLERCERLEQLRILEAGGVIAMGRACRDIPAGVDTPEDLERVRRIITGS